MLNKVQYLYVYKTTDSILFCERTFSQPLRQMDSNNPLYINAVDLKSGNLLYLDDDASVTLVNAEIIIDFYDNTTQE